MVAVGQKTEEQVHIAVQNSVNRRNFVVFKSHSAFLGPTT